MENESVGICIYLRESERRDMSKETFWYWVVIIPAMLLFAWAFTTGVDEWHDGNPHPFKWCDCCRCDCKSKIEQE